MPKSNPESNDFLNHLEDIGKEDAAGLKIAQGHYGNSWKKRGGIGAFMMLARKWDRLDKLMETKALGVECGSGKVTNLYDIFDHIEADERSEGVIDDIRDLRRYLMLVEAEARAMGLPAAQTKHRDS